VEGSFWKRFEPVVRQEYWMMILFRIRR
jgi:hypothetical protein